MILIESYMISSNHLSMKNAIVLLFLFLLVSSCKQEQINSIDLAGRWSFAMDPQDIGEKEHWYETGLEDTIWLPGSMASNHKGFDITSETEWTAEIKDTAWYRNPKFAPYNDPDHFRIPFWLQPEKKYTGAAWYQKAIQIPEEWGQKEVILHLERCHWETTVWLDGAELGTRNSLSTPHIYRFHADAGKHLLTIRVDNRTRDIDVGINSHSITDHTQTNWNGIVGDICLTSEEKLAVNNLVLTPDIDQRSVEVVARVMNRSEGEITINLLAEAELINEDQSSEINPFQQTYALAEGENILTFTYDLGDDALLWDEFEPHLYRLDIRVSSHDIVTECSETFGLREIRVENNQILLNNRRLFLRGTLECAIFPKTGYPSTSREEWKRIFGIIKSYGLNHMRFHSWCPPEAAFDAADEEGIYLQVECGSWANQTTTLGDGKPVDRFIREESRRIVQEYGNHPSFCLMAYGNEPGGRNYQAYLTAFVTWWKKEDGRRLYTAAAGWPQLPVNDYHNIPAPRIQGWGEQLASVINGEPPRTNYDWHSRDRMPDDGIPVISHEIGQWCVYPDFKEMQQYNGVLKAKNFEIFQQSLDSNHMGHLADSFLLASGKLQSICYKADIEAALRTSGLSGFQLLDLHDFPGQGTALVGVLNPFWEEKGYMTAEEYSRFCNSVVPLARMKKRIFLEGDTLHAGIEVANFYKGELTSVEPEWKIRSAQGDIIGQGKLGMMTIPVGNGIRLGDVNFPLPETGMARQLVLEVAVAGYTNRWDLWVYPEHNDVESQLDVYLTEVIDHQALEALENGQNVLLSTGRGKIKEGKGGEVGVGFSSIFWNTAWTNGQKPHTLGILCDPDHPALRQFPTEYHSNWQWWDAMSHADVINLNEFPAALTPIVRVIDDWFSNRRLGLLIEMKVGNGKLLISGIDLYNHLDSRPEARQLLVSLNDYMRSAYFDPEVSVEIGQVLGLMK